MKKGLTIIASSLLLFNGTGALYGGWNLITRPDGSSIQLSMNWLEHTPFTDYLLPGIILFISNGLSSFFVLIVLLLKVNKFYWFVMCQGVILTGWILIQMLLIQTVHSLHVILGCVGIGFIIAGLLLGKIANSRIDKNQHRL